jgi:aerobic carbon-monoxide dehydrogenase medium subunit
VIPASFDYEIAESVDHAVELLATKEDAKLLAGGHSLLPLMKTRLARPGTLVDIGRVAGIAGVTDGGDHLKVGALTRHADLASSEVAKAHCPILAHTA